MLNSLLNSFVAILSDLVCQYNVIFFYKIRTYSIFRTALSTKVRKLNKKQLANARIKIKASRYNAEKEAKCNVDV